MADGYRSLSQQYGSGKGLESIADDYINSFKMQINSMKEWLSRKEDQNFDLLQQLAKTKIYALKLKEFLDRKFVQDGKELPREFHEAPVVLDVEDEMEMIRAEVRGVVKDKEEFMWVSVADQMEKEIRMLKNHLKRHGLLSPAEALQNSEEKAKLLQDVTD